MASEGACRRSEREAPDRRSPFVARLDLGAGSHRKPLLSFICSKIRAVTFHKNLAPEERSDTSRTSDTKVPLPEAPAKPESKGHRRGCGSVATLSPHTRSSTRPGFGLGPDWGLVHAARRSPACLIGLKSTSDGGQGMPDSSSVCAFREPGSVDEPRFWQDSEAVAAKKIMQVLSSLELEAPLGQPDKTPIPSDLREVSFSPKEHLHERGSRAFIVLAITVQCNDPHPNLQGLFMSEARSDHRVPDLRNVVNVQ